jgi:beta-aspartyl-peptidase (threonine type)
MIGLIVHGGCGIWLPAVEAAATAGCREAVAAGRQILQQGGSALDAVVAACTALEDNPLFNAGTGSVLNAAGEAQMDASLMDGSTLRFAAVAAIERVKNPILVAQTIMNTTDHNILVGSGATAFARQTGFVDYDPRTSDRLAEYQFLRAKVPVDALHVRQFLGNHPEHAHSVTTGITTGTVGAVALDAAGNLATATSTGGFALKLSGRVGDSALPGGGTYATAEAAAGSTGTGEYVMQILATRQVCDLIQAGQIPQAAIEQTLDQIQSRFKGETGLIAIDHQGRVGIAHRTPEMPHAFFVGDSEITARLRI